MNNIDCSDITIIPNQKNTNWYYALFRIHTDFKIEINLPIIKESSKSEKEFINRIIIAISHESIHVVNWYSDGLNGQQISKKLDSPFPYENSESSVLSILEKEGYLGV